MGHWCKNFHTAEQIVDVYIVWLYHRWKMLILGKLFLSFAAPGVSVAYNWCSTAIQYVFVA